MTFEETARIHIGAGTPVFYLHEKDAGFVLETIAYNSASSQRADTLRERLRSEDEAIAFCTRHPSAQTPNIVITTVHADGGVTVRAYQKHA